MVYGYARFAQHNSRGHSLPRNLLDFQLVAQCSGRSQSSVFKKLCLFLSSGSRFAGHFCTVPWFTEGLHGWAALSAPSLIRTCRTAICDYSYILSYSVFSFTCPQSGPNSCHLLYQEQPIHLPPETISQCTREELR